MSAPYAPQRAARSLHVPVRGLRYHLLQWGDAMLQSPTRPLLLLAHGWMDVAASFQFVVDAMSGPRHVMALDWRGFGGSQSPPASDTYWFADYLGDLDGLLDALRAQGLAGEHIDLLGHSMGGNIVMSYAGVRPQRIRRLVNLEGFGLPASRAEQAPQRIEKWLDELPRQPGLFSYANAESVAQRLMKNNPRLPADKALWLATQWAEPRADGRWHIRADPGHKRSHPLLYQRDEVLACWERIAAPVLWVEGTETAMVSRWGDVYTRTEFDARLARVPQLRKRVLEAAGHMLHHDQPAALAGVLEEFLD